jgi:hypothetical protein
MCSEEAPAAPTAPGPAPTFNITVPNTPAPVAPDYTPILQASQAASEEMNKLQREQFEWAKTTYAENKGVSDRVVDAFLTTQARSDEWASRDRARYEDIFQPLEDDLARDAIDYSSDERKTQERGRSMATVAQQFEAARANAERNLEGYGVKPTDLRAHALDLGTRVQEAAAKAAAANQSDLAVDATGRALRSEAIGVGKTYPGQIAGTLNTGLQAGSAGANSGLATTASGANTMGTSPQYAGLGNTALNTWGSTTNTGYGNELAGYNAGFANYNAGLSGYNAELAGYNATNSAALGNYNAQLAEYKANSEGSGWGSLIGGVAGMALGGPMGGQIGAKIFAESGGAIPAPPGMSAPQGPTAPTETDGGAVPAQVSPSGGRGVDDVEARLSVGEFIMPDDVARWYGEEKLHKMIIKAREGKAELTEESGAIPTMKKPAPTQALQV